MGRLMNKKNHNIRCHYFCWCNTEALGIKEQIKRCSPPYCREMSIIIGLNTGDRTSVRSMLPPLELLCNVSGRNLKEYAEVGEKLSWNLFWLCSTYLFKILSARKHCFFSVTDKEEDLCYYHSSVITPARITKFGRQRIL